MSKASERLFEVNYCVDASLRSKSRLVWLTPSQVQEAILGYDTLLQRAYGVEIIQFKVPEKRLTRPRSDGGLPCLRINLPHSQVRALRGRTSRSKYVRAHFVFPNAIEIGEYFDAKWDVLGMSYSLDASDLKGIGHPARASGIHFGDFRPDLNVITLHSDPVDVPATPVTEVGGWANEPIGRELAEVLPLLSQLYVEAPTARVAVHLSRDEASQ